MKSLFILASFLGCSIAAYSQHDHRNHGARPAEVQPKSRTQSNGNSDNKALSGLLIDYYNIKNALVAGDASSAASNASVFLRKANTIDFKVLSEGNVHILAKDAGQLTETKDLERQRVYFARLSNNMATIAKDIKLDNKEVYLQYCPMKKASWLSSENQIRNPYYGAAMLSCGEVTGTF